MQDYNNLASDDELAIVRNQEDEYFSVLGIRDCEVQCIINHTSLIPKLLWVGAECEVKIIQNAACKHTINET